MVRKFLYVIPKNDLEDDFLMENTGEKRRYLKGNKTSQIY